VDSETLERRAGAAATVWAAVWSIGTFVVFLFAFVRGWPVRELVFVGVLYLGASIRCLHSDIRDHQKARRDEARQ
jgi:hypothetical protein